MFNTNKDQLRRDQLRRETDSLEQSKEMLKNKVRAYEKKIECLRGIENTIADAEKKLHVVTKEYCRVLEKMVNLSSRDQKTADTHCLEASNFIDRIKLLEKEIETAQIVAKYWKDSYMFITTGEGRTE